MEIDNVWHVVTTANRLAVVRQISQFDYVFHFHDMDKDTEEVFYAHPDNRNVLKDIAAYISEYYQETPAPELVSDSVKIYERIKHEHSTPNRD